MAKKAATKKTNELSAQDQQTLVCVAALEKFAARLKSKLEDKDAKLAEGSYVCDLNLVVRGDVIVDKPSEIPAQTKVDPGVSGRLLPAIFASLGFGRPDIRKHLKAAMKRIKQSNDGESKKSLDIRSENDIAAEMIETLVPELAQELELMVEVPASVRRGAVRSKPTGRIEGDVGENTIDLDLTDINDE